MKRYGYLFEKLVDMDNLDLAERKARKGKSMRGEVRKFLADRENNLATLQRMLIDGTFTTSRYHNFIIYEPKERMISRLPYFPDRIVHHAILNILEPIWVSHFTADTYSCIKRRGIHPCAQKLKHALHSDPEGTRYCLKLDVHKFYPSIDHDILKGILRRKVKDEQFLAVVDNIIDSAPGLPIGNYISSYLANLYLTELDHAIKEELRIRHYWRYADDMVLLAGDKSTLHAALVFIRERLAVLKLEIKGNWQIFPVEARGIDFVGYVFRHDYTLLRKGIKIRMGRRIRRLAKENAPAEKVRQNLSGWLGWCKWCNSRNLLKKFTKILENYEEIFRHGAASPAIIG